MPQHSNNLWPSVESSSALDQSTTPDKTTTPPASLIRSISDCHLSYFQDKVVFVRCDFNVLLVPVSNHKNDNNSKDLPSSDLTGSVSSVSYQVRPESRLKIVETLPTIQYLIQAGAKVVIASHLDNPTSPSPRTSLRAIHDSLQRELPEVNVSFVEDCIGPKVRSAVAGLSSGSVLLLENLRYHSGEKANGLDFINALIDDIGMSIYICDAFATAHRRHASMVGVPAELARRNEAYLQQQSGSLHHHRRCESSPNTAKSALPYECLSGFLLAKEIRYLTQFLPQTPRSQPDSTSALNHQYQHQPSEFIVLFGGSKIESKLTIFRNLLSRVDTMCIGGAIARTFLRAQGYTNVSDFGSEKDVDTARALIQEAKAHNVAIVLPVDFMSCTFFDFEAKHSSPTETRVVSLSEATEDLFLLDLGPKSIELFSNIINHSKYVLWNGPMGKWTCPELSTGSFSLMNLLSKRSQEDPEHRHFVACIGGGATSTVAESARVNHQINVAAIAHISTGGGAFLQFLEDFTLPAVEALKASQQLILTY